MHHHGNTTMWILMVAIATLTLWMFGQHGAGERHGMSWMPSHGDTAPNTQHPHMDNMGMMGGVSPTESGLPSEPDAEEAIMIEVKDFKFAPAELRVTVGQTVTWINRDGAGHNVVFENTNEAGLMMGQNETWSYQFTRAGIYNYYCGPHPFMVAKIIVEE